MKIIDRYILGLFIKFFLSALVTLLTLFIVIAFFDLIDELASNHARPSLVLSYFLLKIPEATMHMTPMSVLIASILTFSMLSRSRELVIMMSCGLSNGRIAMPVIIAALAISTLTFLNSEYIVPATWKKSRTILRHDIKKIPMPSTIRKDRIWYKTEDGTIWNIGFLGITSGRLHDLTVMRFTPDRSRFSSIITASEAFQENGKWQFVDGFTRVFMDDGKFREDIFDTKEFAFSINFDELSQAVKKHQEMNMKEIRSYIKRIQKAGYDDTRYKVDMYAKATFPLISLVMAFIAIPFGLKTSRAGGVLFGIVVSISIGFIFWFFFSMSLSLGRNGILPPLLAACAAHIIFLLGAGYKIASQYRTG